MMKIFRKNYFRRLILTTITTMLLVALCSGKSFAQDNTVREFIDGVAQQLINTISNRTLSTQGKRNRVKSVIEKNFDVIWMSRFAMGHNYRKLSESQKKRYQSLYLSYLLNNYFPILVRYDADDSYQILQINKVDKRDYDVKLRLITKKSESPIRLKYRIRYADEQYKCLDMVVEGVSTLISQRDEFRSTIQQLGINAFLNKLAAQKLKNIKVTSTSVYIPHRFIR